jgi:hypothetical protein
MEKGDTIRELVEIYGDDAIEEVQGLIDRRLAAFAGWLSGRGIAGLEAESHLGNCYLMLELMADCPPHIFPEEISDDEDEFSDMDDSTACAFKYFVYSNFIRRGPRTERERSALLESIRLYFDFLLEGGVIDRVPAVVSATVAAVETYRDRISSFDTLDEKFSTDDRAWIAAFEEWLADFNKEP